MEAPEPSFLLSGCPRGKVSPWHHVGPLPSLFWVLTVAGSHAGSSLAASTKAFCHICPTQGSLGLDLARAEGLRGWVPSGQLHHQSPIWGLLSYFPCQTFLRGGHRGEQPGLLGPYRVSSHISTHYPSSAAMATLPCPAGGPGKTFVCFHRDSEPSAAATHLAGRDWPGILCEVAQLTSKAIMALAIVLHIYSHL